MKQVASRTGTSGDTTWVTGTCRVGNGTKRHFAIKNTRTWESGKQTTTIQPGYGCVTSDRQAHKANGFSAFGVVTCTSCYPDGLEVLRA